MHTSTCTEPNVWASEVRSQLVKSTPSNTGFFVTVSMVHREGEELRGVCIGSGVGRMCVCRGWCGEGVCVCVCVHVHMCSRL